MSNWLWFSRHSKTMSDKIAAINRFAHNRKSILYAMSCGQDLLPAHVIGAHSARQAICCGMHCILYSPSHHLPTSSLCVHPLVCLFERLTVVSARAHMRRRRMDGGCCCSGGGNGNARGANGDTRRELWQASDMNLIINVHREPFRVTERQCAVLVPACHCL